MVGERALILLRHAKSDWSTGDPDLRRPLTERGRRQAREAGRWLEANAPDVELAVISPARRTRETWELASSELTSPVRAVVEDEVYAASGSALWAVVRRLDSSVRTVILVGHNPGLEDLMSGLTGGWVAMPTSCLAVLELPASWVAATPGTAVLGAFGRPPTPIG